MKWWQVALKVKTAPGLNGDAIQIIFDVEAESREEAIEAAKAALVARADVDFAIGESL